MPNTATITQDHEGPLSPSAATWRLRETRVGNVLSGEGFLLVLSDDAAQLLRSYLKATMSDLEVWDLARGLNSLYPVG